MCEEVKERIINIVNEMQDITFLWMVLDFIETLKK